MIDRRVTLAQELHDGIAQDLVGLGFSIDSLIASIKDPTFKEPLRAVRFTITGLIEKVRLEIHQLRSAEDLISEDSALDYPYELLRVVSEILRNVSEHSQATHLSMAITDNGLGGAHSKEGRFGIAGIQERIIRLNGDIHIDSTERGTRISIELPLAR